MLFDFGSIRTDLSCLSGTVLPCSKHLCRQIRGAKFEERERDDDDGDNDSSLITQGERGKTIMIDDNDTLLLRERARE